MLNDLVRALKRYTDAHTGESPYATPIEGFTILRSDQVKRPAHHILKPALCMVLQGAKWTAFGGRRVHYRAGQALVVNVEMPMFGTVAAASRKNLIWASLSSSISQSCRRSLRDWITHRNQERQQGRRHLRNGSHRCPK